MYVPTNIFLLRAGMKVEFQFLSCCSFLESLVAGYRVRFIRIDDVCRELVLFSAVRMA
jgi:hypothetical protein